MDDPREIGMMPAARRDHDETTEAEPQPGLQGEGGLGAIKGRGKDSDQILTHGVVEYGCFGL